MTKNEIIKELMELSNSWDPDDCIDFGYYAKETIDEILESEVEDDA